MVRVSNSHMIVSQYAYAPRGGRRKVESIIWRVDFIIEAAFSLWPNCTPVVTALVDAPGSFAIAAAGIVISSVVVPRLFVLGSKTVFHNLPLLSSSRNTA